MTEDVPIRLLNLFRALEERCEEVERLAVRLMEIAKASGNCVRSELLRDVQDLTQFALILDFPSEEHLEAYLGNDARREALKALPDLVHEDIRRIALAPVASPSKADG